jgi:hypothetical protein
MTQCSNPLTWTLKRHCLNAYQPRKLHPHTQFNQSNSLPHFSNTTSPRYLNTTTSPFSSHQLIPPHSQPHQLLKKKMTNDMDEPPADASINTEDGLRYWEGIQPDDNGMLGGFAYISKVDLQGSRNFLAKLGIGRAGKGLRSVESALEGGAGYVPFINLFTTSYSPRPSSHMRGQVNVYRN